VGGDLAYFSQVQTKQLPWPFKVNAGNGIVIDEKCSWFFYQPLSKVQCQLYIFTVLSFSIFTIFFSQRRG